MTLCARRSKVVENKISKIYFQRFSSSPIYIHTSIIRYESLIEIGPIVRRKFYPSNKAF